MTLQARREACSASQPQLVALAGMGQPSESGMCNIEWPYRGSIMDSSTACSLQGSYKQLVSDMSSRP